MYSKAKYLAIQLALALVSPFASMCIAVRYYRNPLSWLFMVIFAYYFGSHMYMGVDATEHYGEMMAYYYGASFDEIINNPIVFLHWGEPYAFLLKFIVSRFTSSPMVFGGVICVIYMLLQINFFTAFNKLYKNRLSLLSGILFFVMLTVVQFSWYQGVRYWPGVFWFMGFTLRYVMTQKKYHLVLACLCPFMHYSLILLPVALVANYVLMKCGFKVHTLIFLLSFVVRASGIDFWPFLLEHTPFLDAYYDTLTVSSLDRVKVVEIMEELRADSNPVYSIRSEVLALALLVIAATFKYKRVVFSDTAKYFLAFALTMATFANVEYADITFYDRFFKVAVLLFAIFIFVTAVDNKQLLNGHSAFLIAYSTVVLAFEVVTQFWEVRIGYMHLELWFGNFFMNWHGGFDEFSHAKWGDLFM